jgi:hypothetical protein
MENEPIERAVTNIQWSPKVIPRFLILSHQNYFYVHIRVMMNGAQTEKMWMDL